MTVEDVIRIGLSTFVGFTFGYWHATSKRARRVRVAWLWRKTANRRRHDDRPPL